MKRISPYMWCFICYTILLQLMNLLFSFLNADHSHSTLLAGYFSKVFLCGSLAFHLLSMLFSVIENMIPHNLLFILVFFLGCYMSDVTENCSSHELCSGEWFPQLKDGSLFPLLSGYWSNNFCTSLLITNKKFRNGSFKEN